MATATAQPPSGISLEQMAEALATSATQAYENAMAAPPGSLANKYFHWCRTPQVGQLVVEVSTRRTTPALRRTGILRSVAEEPIKNWDPTLNGPAGTRKVYTLEGLDGQELRWENCLLIAVPQEQSP